MRSNRQNSNGFTTLEILLVILVVVAVGAIGWYAWQRTQANENNSSLNVATDTPASETEEQKPVVEKTGTFTGVSPKTGSGSVSLVKNPNGTYMVRLEDDFAVQSGPALYVAFANGTEVDHDTLFAALKETSGQQEYIVPSEVDPVKYTNVVIYCEEFSVTFSTAELKTV